jgi:hypothetical protein
MTDPMRLSPSTPSETQTHIRLSRLVLGMKCNAELKSSVNNFPKLPYRNLSETKSLNVEVSMVRCSLEMEQVSKWSCLQSLWCCEMRKCGLQGLKSC